jgi:predicted MFS family arabinose efflux permease
MIFAMLINSLFTFLFSVNISAYLSENAPPDKLGSFIGTVEVFLFIFYILQLSWALSTLIGIPLLAQLATKTNLSVTFIVIGGPMFVCAILMAAALPNHIHQQKAHAKKEPSSDSDSIAQKHDLSFHLEKWKSVFFNRSALLFILFEIFLTAASTILFANYSIWFEQYYGMKLNEIGWATTSIGFAEVLASSSTLVFADRIGRSVTLVIGVCLSIISYIILAFLGEVSLSMSIVSLFLGFYAYEFSLVIFDILF